MSAGLDLGIGLIVAGSAFVLLVWLAMRVLPRHELGPALNPGSLIAPDSSQSVDAVLLLQPGGRVEYLNDVARAYFEVRENEPYDLERLARRVRSSEDFLQVCAAPGQKQVSIGGRLAQAASYQIPGAYPLMLISLRALDVSPALAAQGGEAAATIVKVVSEFGTSIAAGVDLDAAIRAILENVSRLIPSDALELKLWDAQEQTWTAYRLQEGASGTTRAVLAATSQFGGLAARLAASGLPLLIEDTRRDPEFGAGGEALAIQSYLGLPLIAAGELVGALEAGQTGGTFGQPDLELLRLVASQAAFTLRNARLYEEQRRQAAELAGLSNLGHALGTIIEPRDLFARLVETLVPLFGFEVLGILLYDEDKRTLEAQLPFHGLPTHLVEIYRASVPAGSPAEAVLAEQQPIVTLDAATDATWRALGLNDIAVAASLRDTALIPLTAAGRSLGLLQVGHHRAGPTAFSAAELKLLTRAADEAAAVIETVLLVQRARNQAKHAEALGRIASLSSSSAAVEEVLQYAVQEMAQLFKAEVGAIFLLDEVRGELGLRAESQFGFPDGAAASLVPISMDEPGFHTTVTGSQRPLLSGRLSGDRHLPPVYGPLSRALGLESAVVVPLLARDRSLGELLLGSFEPEHFSANDLQVISTAAGQLASAVDSSGLLSQTDESLRQRAEQLTAIARVSRELSATLEPGHLLQVIRDESLRITGADCGSILVIDPEGDGKLSRVELTAGCTETKELSALERSALQAAEPIIITDFAEQTHFPPHDGVRSSLVAPILHDGRAIGAIHVHAREPGRFAAALSEPIQILASQAGIALVNARKFQGERQRGELLRRRAETLVKLADVSHSLSHDQPLEQSLHTIATGIRDSTPFQVVLISTYEPETGLLRRVTAVGVSQETLSELLARKQPLASLQQLMQPQFKIGRSFFVPADQTPILPRDVHYVYSTYETRTTETTPNTWDPDDFLLLPLSDADGKPLGLISVDDPSDTLRPDRATIESIEAFAAQAALVISNSQKAGELRGRIDSLSSGIERQQKLLSVTQNDLPVLLRKDLEQTISLHNLDRRVQRVRAGLAITESVSRQLDASSALLALGRETLTQIGMTTALVAENGRDGPRLLHVLGSLPRTINVEALFGQRNPLRGCLQTGKPILLPSLDESEEWRDAPLLTALRAKGVICLPVSVENEPVAAMLAVSPEPLPALTEEDRQVYLQISRQTSVILQNISLLSETRRRLQEVNLLLDFSRLLSGLDPEAVVTALLESARRVLQSAHAGLVLVWNPQADLLIPRVVSGYADNGSMMRINYRSGEALPGGAFAARQARRVDEINFARDYALSAENLAMYRQATGGRLPVSSLLVPILVGDQPLGMLVLDNFNTAAAFKAEDEALLLSLTQQVALSLENVRLMQATQERAGQLQALNSAAAALTTNLRSDQLVSALLDQLPPVLPYDTATLWLRDKERLSVAAARGFPDSEQRLGLTIAVSDSVLFNQMARSGESISVGDVREDARFPRVEAPRLSWLGVPLISKGELIGVMALEKWQPHFYSREQLQVGLTFASQAAVSLENARLYEESLSRAAELDQRSQRLALLNRFSSALSGLLDTDQILLLTAEELLKALGNRRVSVVVFERGQAIWKAATPRVRYKLPKVLPNSPIFGRLSESLGVFHTDDARTERDLSGLADMLGETTGLVVLPLASGTILHALLFAQAGGPDRFGVNEIELARTIANQAAIALENARLYQATVQTAQRLAILNETSAQVSARLDPEEIYVSVHKAAQRLMPVESFVISLLDETADEIEGVYLVDGETRSPVTRISRRQGLSGQVISTGQPLLLHGLGEVESAQGVTYGKSDSPLSLIAVPMTLGGKTLGMLSVQSYQPGVYSAEDQQILGTLANQAIVAIQNARLFAETQRLAEELEQRVIERTAQLQHEQQNTETLLRILTEVSSSLDLDRALNRTLSLLNDAIGAEQGTIMLLQAEDNLLHFRAGYGYLSERGGPGGAAGFTLKIGEGLAGWVIQNREPVLASDLHADPRWVQASAGADHRSAIVVPMLVGEDVIGVLMVFHRTPAFFSAEMLNLVKAIASQVAVAINNAHLYELIRDQAERLGVMLRKEQEDASRSQAILEAVADGVLVTGADNRITFVNSSTERILSLKEGRVLGSPLDVFGGLFGKAAGAWMETIRRWSEEPASHQAGDTYAEQLELENGRIALVHLAPVILQDDFLGTVSIFRDITHEVEVDRLKSEFVATVSHELRTPMTAIKGYVDILMMGAAGALNENQSHFLEIVGGNIDRLNVLVNDLLDISRIEAGKVVLAPQPVDLRELAQDVIAEVSRRSQDEKKPMSLSLEAPKDLPRVYGDTERVRQILDNLVDNAFNYTPENGTIRVNLRALNGAEVQVDVQDNGMGIAPDDQERVFERFYRGENPLVLATPGTGLGLPIVRQLVQMHKGRIWMQSKGLPGEGSTFSFTLPVYKSA